jgi:hypothetical protein
VTRRPDDNSLKSFVMLTQEASQRRATYNVGMFHVVQHDIACSPKYNAIPRL